MGDVTYFTKRPYSKNGLYYTNDRRLMIEESNFAVGTGSPDANALLLLSILKTFSSQNNGHKLDILPKII